MNPQARIDYTQVIPNSSGKLMSIRWIILAGVVAFLLPRITRAAATLNGWDTSNVYVIRNNLFQDGIPQVPPNSIEIVTESALIPPGLRTRFGNVLVYDDLEIKTLAFSNSPVAGANSPAGARMFLAEAYPSGGPYTDVFLNEYSSSAQLLRKFYLGGAFAAGNGQLVPNQAGNNLTVGSIRYNLKKNTLAVSATLATNGGATVRAKVFEFALPDWAADNGTAAHPVTPVQVYEAPAGHTINSNHPTNIDFDDDGNLYMTGKTFDANGQGGGFKPDLIKINTLGLNGGTSTYVIPITGANAGNLLIEGSIENQTSDYSAIWTLAVRTANGSIMLTPRTDEVAGMPTLEYSLTAHTGNGNLLLIHNWGPDPSGLGLNSQVTAAQRDPESGAVFVSCFRGEPGGGPKRINAAGTIDVIGWRNWDVASPPPLPPPTADSDHDGDVDQSDFGFLQQCFVAPPNTIAQNCRSIDLVTDNSINSLDLAQFLLCMNGANRPPACSN